MPDCREDLSDCRGNLLLRKPQLVELILRKRHEQEVQGVGEFGFKEEAISIVSELWVFLHNFCSSNMEA